MNLRQVKTKIRSISNVKKITKAMQLVSAVKMKKAQQLALDGRPYREELNTILHKISQRIDLSNVQLFEQKKENKDKKKLVIVISSNKGLCGSFNMNLFRVLLKGVDYKHSEFVTLGSKGSMFLARTGGKIAADYSISTPLMQTTALFEMALDRYLKGEFSEVSIVYNKFVSTLRSEPVIEQLLPVRPTQPKETKEDVSNSYLIEPSPREIIEQLFKSYIEEKIRGAVIESEASEHSQRMLAMKNATDNANDVIYSLTLLGNKLRQEKITYELLDMITAKESQDSN